MHRNAHDTRQARGAPMLSAHRVWPVEDIYVTAQGLCGSQVRSGDWHYAPGCLVFCQRQEGL